MTLLGQKINQYVFLERKGSSMNVFVAKDETSDEEVIVKVFASNLSESDQKAMESEIKVGMKLSHKCMFLVEYKEIVIKKDNSFLIMEHCKGDNLAKRIADRIKSNKPFTDDEIFEFILQVGNGVRTLHEEDIVHRDLKPDNIFSTLNNLLKVGDFGIARSIGKTTVVMASLGYAPPEVFDGEDKPSKAMDVYSLGCIVLEMLDMRHPFANEKNVVQQRRVLSGSANPPRLVLSAAAKAVRDFALQMVSENPAKRPPIDALLSLPSVVSFALGQYVRSTAERDELKREKDVVTRERDIIKAERDSVMRERDVLKRETARMKEEISLQAQRVAELTDPRQTRLPMQTQTSLQPELRVQKAAPSSLPVRLIIDTSNDNDAVVVAKNPAKCTWIKQKNFWGILDVEMNTGVYQMTIKCTGDLDGLAFGVVHKSLINNHKGKNLFNCKEAWCVGDNGIYNQYSVRDKKPVFEANLFKSANKGANKATLSAVVDADAHTLRFFAADRLIPHCVTAVPPDVRFAFSNDSNGVVVEVTSVQKGASLSIDTTLQCAVSDWNLEIQKAKLSSI